MRFVMAFAILGACGPSHVDKDPGNNDGTDGGGNEPGTDAPSTTGDDAEPMPDSSCGMQTSNIGVVNLGDPPDLLLVNDRSGSMNELPPTFPPIFNTKWNIMRDALKSVVMAKQTQIKFGLLEFPSDDNCAADATPEVAIALNASPALNTYFAVRAATGNTPAHFALQSALAYYNTIPVNTAGRYVLFATDGLPNCGGGVPETASDTETVQAVTALFNAGIKTFVLGFGQFGGNATLNNAAIAGGVPKAGATKYYEVTNPAQLDMALNAIAGGIIVPSCSFQLASVPPDPDNVTVKLNGMVVPRSPSHTNGWDYHPNAMTITFFGTYCDQIMAGAMTSVSFVYGCPGPVIN